MTTHNLVQLTGRAGHQPRLVTLSDGTALARLRLYHDTTNAAGDRIAVPFTLVAWGPLAERFYATVHRGDGLFVSGKLTLRRVRRDSEIHTHPEININSFYPADKEGAKTKAIAGNSDDGLRSAATSGTTAQNLTDE